VNNAVFGVFERFSAVVASVNVEGSSPFTRFRRTAVDHIRILMGKEVSRRTQQAFREALKPGTPVARRAEEEAIVPNYLRPPCDSDMSKKLKLELTWVGKEQRPRLEPRVLLEDPARSYGDLDADNPFYARSDESLPTYFYCKHAPN